MPAQTHQLAPHRTHQPSSVRKAYIQNLTDLLHVCLLRRDLPRARRAWAILIRCREVDWKSRWSWGLECLNAATSDPQDQGRDAEKWLRTVRVSAKEVEKPLLLHALVLHLIKSGHYRQALDELHTSYPYLLSGPLHTYAGLLCFFLAQPTPALHLNETTPGHASRDSTPSVSRQGSPMARAKNPPNPTLYRQARAYFVKALTLDESDEVANGFIGIIDHPDNNGDRDQSSEKDDEDGKSDEDNEKGKDRSESESDFDIDSDSELEDFVSDD